MARNKRLNDRFAQRIKEAAEAHAADQPAPPASQARAALIEWLRNHPLEHSANLCAPARDLRCEKGMIQGHPVAGATASLYDGTAPHRSSFTIGVTRAGKGRLTVVFADGHVIARDIPGPAMGRASQWIAVLTAYAASLTGP
jgi:prepilin-type processing-associated H-X9-DG protein